MTQPTSSINTDLLKFTDTSEMSVKKKMNICFRNRESQFNNELQIQFYLLTRDNLGIKGINRDNLLRKLLRILNEDDFDFFTIIEFNSAN